MGFRGSRQPRCRLYMLTFGNGYCSSGGWPDSLIVSCFSSFSRGGIPPCGVILPRCSCAFSCRLHATALLAVAYVVDWVLVDCTGTTINTHYASLKLSIAELLVDSGLRKMKIRPVSDWGKSKTVPPCRKMPLIASRRRYKQPSSPALKRRMPGLLGWLRSERDSDS